MLKLDYAFEHWMILCDAFIFTVSSKDFTTHLFEVSGRTYWTVLAITPILLHVKITCRINSSAISTNFWSSSTPLLCCCKCRSIWIKRMLILHMSIHSWIGQIGTLTYLTLEISRLILTSLSMKFRPLPLILWTSRWTIIIHLLISIVDCHILIAIIFDHIRVHLPRSVHQTTFNQYLVNNNKI